MNRGRVIGFISGKGGVGKTSLCVNLGAALNSFGKEVTVVDADFSASNLGVHLGRYDHAVKIQDVLEGNSEVQNAIFRHPTGMKAISSSSEINRVEPELEQFKQVLEHASQESEYVLVDCPPGLNRTVETVMDACDELVIVTMPTQTAGQNAAQIIERAKTMQKSVLGTIVNKVEDDPERELIEREVEMMTESHILSNIPYDENMKSSIFHSEPLIHHEPLSEASIEIKRLAAEMEGIKYEKPSFAKLKRSLKKVKDTFSK